MVDRMTDDEIGAFVVENKWKFAKSMPKMPHEYCLKEYCTDLETFNRFVLHIREYGYEGWFWRKKFMYFDYDGYQYWTMGNTLEITKLINRAKLKEEPSVRFTDA